MLAKAPILTLIIIALMVWISESKSHKHHSIKSDSDKSDDEDLTDQVDSSLSTKHKKHHSKHHKHSKHSKKHSKSRKEHATADENENEEHLNDDQLEPKKNSNKMDKIHHKLTVILKNFFKGIADTSTCFRQDFDKTECGQLADECYGDLGFFDCVKLLECVMKVSEKCTKHITEESTTVKDLGMGPPPPMSSSP